MGGEDQAGGQKARYMVLKVTAAAPGVELVMRPLDQDLASEARHFRLQQADCLRSEFQLNALINTTLYVPSEWWKSFPGAKVRSLESLVFSGRQTHYHEHSYLVGFMNSGRLIFDLAKPPKPAMLESVVWGFGVQGVQLREGQVFHGSLGQGTPATALTAVGCDRTQTHIFLAAHEHSHKAEFLDLLTREGVWTAALMDSGSAANFVLDGSAAGLKPFTGIRGARPIAAFLGLRAKPIKREMHHR